MSRKAIPPGYALKLEGRAGRQGYCLWLVPHPTRGFLKPLRTGSRQEKASSGEADTARSAITTRIKAAHTLQPRSPPEVCQVPSLQVLLCAFGLEILPVSV